MSDLIKDKEKEEQKILDEKDLPDFEKKIKEMEKIIQDSIDKIKKEKK
jgi:hypothetical protein